MIYPPRPLPGTVFMLSRYTLTLVIKVTSMEMIFHGKNALADEGASEVLSIHISTEITPVIGTHIGPGAVGFAIVQAINRQGMQRV